MAQDHDTSGPDILCPDILCIGSVLWDVLGRTHAGMVKGNDVPGRIERVPGGVALNIARTLAGFGLHPALLSVVGCDPEGGELVASCEALGLITAHMLRDPELPTDRYMAIEDTGGLVAAICDAHSLETAGARVLAPCLDGRLGSEAAPWSGPIALDGNLTEPQLLALAEHPAFHAADLRIAPASPGKATRLTPILAHPGATLYVNLEEAGLILGHVFQTAVEAADALVSAGATRALVTDGARLAALGEYDETIAAAPPKVAQARVTGAGDTFMAAHIAAETRGIRGREALNMALEAAASFVSGKDVA